MWGTPTLSNGTRHDDIEHNKKIKRDTQHKDIHYNGNVVMLNVSNSPFILSVIVFNVIMLSVLASLMGIYYKGKGSIRSSTQWVGSKPCT